MRVRDSEVYLHKELKDVSTARGRMGMKTFSYQPFVPLGESPDTERRDTEA